MRIDGKIHEGPSVVVVVFLACSTLGEPKKDNFQLRQRLCENFQKIHEGPGVVVVVFLACSTLGKPKKLNFQLWVRLGEKLLKNS